MVTTQVFAKRFWGFDPSLWPVISFHLAGNRQALIRESRPGDLIVFIGTETEDTAPEERGRLLGIAEIGRIEIETADAIDVARLNANAFDADGRLRWPKALPMVRAWRFVNRPRVLEVLQRQLPYPATVRAVLLDPIDTKAVLSLPREEVAVADVDAIVRQRRLNDALSFGGATTGPRPTSWEGSVGRDAEEPSFAYAFRFGTHELWKIGHAKDVAARLDEVNRHVPHEVIGQRWCRVLEHRWPSEGAAYDMEQRLLAALRKPDSVGERVACSKRAIETAWSAALILS